jgi:hypothetical protein
MKMTGIEKGIIVAMVLLLGAIIAGGIAMGDEKEKFLASCTQQEPAYQCEVKWKQMHPDPIVVYAPLNR